MAVFDADFDLLARIADAWLNLSPAGRAYILPHLITFEAEHRDD